MDPHSRMAPLFFLVLVCLSLLSGAFSTVTTEGDKEVLEGQSITVPCHYNPQYTQNVKYWCWGSSKTFCKTLARTDDPSSAPFSNARVTIVDDPTQRVFTVTMRELKESDSGWYWCGVEVEGMWTADSTGHLYITVKHGMSVMKSMVSGEERGNVTIQCLYSEKHRESKKRWCRSGHMSSCKVTDSNGTFSSRSLLISDDRKSMLNVTMRELEMRDAGWYWCGSGEQQVAVHVEVTPKPTTTAMPPITTVVGLMTHGNELSLLKDQDSHSSLQLSLIVCGTLLLLLIASLVVWKTRQHCKKNPRHSKPMDVENVLTMSPSTGGDWNRSSLILLNNIANQIQNSGRKQRD